MRTRRWAGWVVVGVIGAAGCSGYGSSSSSSGTSSGTHLSCPPPEPVNHRASADPCPHHAADTCATDADCGSEACACAETMFGGNACVGGNCRVDADCGPGFFCSPVAGQGPGTVGGFFCHTCNDVCVNDSDCGADPMYGSLVCTYFPAEEGLPADWACTWPPWSGP